MRRTLKAKKVDDLVGGNGCKQVGALEVVEGRVGEALLYDGIDDGVTCGNDASLANIFDGGGTFMAWAYPRGMGQNDQGRLGDKDQWTLMQRFERPWQHFVCSCCIHHYRRCMAFAH